MSDYNNSQVPLTAADKLVAEFQSLWKATAQNILLMGELIKRVDELDEETKTAFYLGVGFPANSSTARKWRTIGNAAVALTPYAARLPNNWTTVYQIARLNDNDRAELIKSNRLHPSMTALQLKAGNPKQPESDQSNKPKRSGSVSAQDNEEREITIGVKNLSVVNAQAFFKIIREACEKFACDFSAHDDLLAFLDSSK